MSDLKPNNLNAAKYRIGEASKFVGCSALTLKNYEKQGYLKTPVVRDANDNRRYSKQQMMNLRAVWLARNPQ